MLKVLIVDDEKPVQKVIQALGRWSKYNITSVSTASNGVEALQAMHEIKPDIVFADINMPLMDGMTFLKQAQENFEGVKYIIISGYDDFAYAKMAIRLGVVDYLLKPIVEEELDRAIETAVSRLTAEPLTNANEKSMQTYSINETVLIIKDFIDKNYAKDMSLTYFSEKYFFSKEYLSKVFKERYDIGIYEYALKVRMERARTLLENDSLSISDISERLGYNDSNYFSKAFRTYFGMSPSKYRGVMGS